MLFSYRNNLIANIGDLSKLKNRVWNTFEQLINLYYNNCVTIFEPHIYETAEPLFYHVTDKLGLDSTNKNSYRLHEDLHDFLNNAQEINLIFDFIEAQLEIFRSPNLFDKSFLPYYVDSVNLKPVYKEAIKRYGQIIEDLNFPYQLYKNHVVALVDKHEMSAIESAASCQFNSVSTHIKKHGCCFQTVKIPIMRILLKTPLVQLKLCVLSLLE